MEGNDEGEVRRRAAVAGGGLGHQMGPGTPDPRRNQHRMPEAGHRKQLGYALDKADDNGLGVR
jgi:hypothetical protein